MTLVQCIQDQASFYKKLVSELKFETKINQEHAAVKAERQNLERDIAVKKKEIIALEENSKKEFKDVRKMRHLSFRSAAATLSGKKKSLVAKEEAKYQLAFENEQRARRDLEAMEILYNSTLNKEEYLVRQKSQFDETRYQFNMLLEQIFVLEDPNFPMEPRLKAELSNYIEQKHLATRDKSRFVEAEKALTTCLGDTKKVIRLLDTVVNYVPFEIFGGPIIDQEQLAYIDASRRRLWEIQRLLNVARTVLPEIPYPQTLDVVTNNPLLHMQINMNYVDIAWKTKTTQCFGMLATAYRNIQNSLTWVKQYLDYTTGAIERLNTALESTKLALEKERCRIIDIVLDGYVDNNNCSSSSNTGLPTFSTTYHDSNELPPPVYEAPPTGTNTNTLQQNNMPTIPTNLTPTSSLSNFPLNDHSPVIPAALPSPVDNSAPPHPITPVFGHTDIIHPSTSTSNPPYVSSNTPYVSSNTPYVSSNTNNPFK